MGQPWVTFLTLLAVPSLLVSAAELCNTVVALPQSKYSGTFTWQGTTRTVGTVSSTASGNFQVTRPTGTSSSSHGGGTIDWNQLGTDAVNGVGFKRRDHDEFKCQSNQVCLNNDLNNVPFCIDKRTGGWYGATGYEGNVVSGEYSTPSGAKGNIYQGPCPGDLYVQASKGCSLSSSGSSISSAPTSGSSTSSVSKTQTPTPTPNFAIPAKTNRCLGVPFLAAFAIVGCCLV